MKLTSRTAQERIGLRWQQKFAARGWHCLVVPSVSRKYVTVAKPAVKWAIVLSVPTDDFEVYTWEYVSIEAAVSVSGEKIILQYPDQGVRYTKFPALMKAITAWHSTLDDLKRTPTQLNRFVPGGIMMA